MRLIDADALGVGRCSKDILPAAYCAGWNGLIGLIEKAPTIDAVPVVRCRECKHWHEETGFCEKNSYFVDGDGVCCSPADSPNWTMFDPDDFCSYGERKEGADNG